MDFQLIFQLAGFCQSGMAIHIPQQCLRRQVPVVIVGLFIVILVLVPGGKEPKQLPWVRPKGNPHSKSLVAEGFNHLLDLGNQS